VYIYENQTKFYTLLQVQAVFLFHGALVNNLAIKATSAIYSVSQNK